MQCHICQQSLQTCFMAQCSRYSCRLFYCENCTHAYFNDIFKREQYCLQKWICFSCKKLCKCKMCLGIGVLAIQNMIIKRMTSKQNTQTLDDQKNGKQVQQGMIKQQRQQQAKEKVSALQRMLQRYNRLYGNQRQNMKGIVEPKHDASIIKQLKLGDDQKNDPPRIQEIN